MVPRICISLLQAVTFEYVISGENKKKGVVPYEVLSHVRLDKLCLSFQRLIYKHSQTMVFLPRDKRLVVPEERLLNQLLPAKGEYSKT